MSLEKVTIYYNPKCSKCREGLSILENQSCTIEIVEYLKEIPTKSELKQLCDTIGILPSQLIRRNEKIFDAYRNNDFSEDAYLDLLIQHPQLIERPIVVKGNKAIVGRPPSLILDLF